MCHALKIKGKMIHKKIVMQRELGGGGGCSQGDYMELKMQLHSHTFTPPR